MDFLIEILLELVFEGSIEISSNKKVPKWIRYPAIIFISLFLGVVIFGLIGTGIYVIVNGNIPVGTMILIIGLVLLTFTIIDFRKKYIDKKEN